MPEPQTGTSTVVSTDVNTGIRLGIGSHSVGPAQAPVKSRGGERSVEHLAGSTRSNYPSDFHAGQGSEYQIPCGDLRGRDLSGARLAGASPSRRRRTSSREPAGDSSVSLPTRKATRSGRREAPSPRSSTRTRCVRHRRGGRTRSVRARGRVMDATEKIWMNGELVDWGEAKVHVGVHALHYGSGVFE